MNEKCLNDQCHIHITRIQPECIEATKTTSWFANGLFKTKIIPATTTTCSWYWTKGAKNRKRKSEKNS